MLINFKRNEEVRVLDWTPRSKGVAGDCHFFIMWP